MSFQGIDMIRPSPKFPIRIPGSWSLSILLMPGIFFRLLASTPDISLSDRKFAGVIVAPQGEFRVPPVQIFLQKNHLGLNTSTSPKPT